MTTTATAAQVANETFLAFFGRKDTKGPHVEIFNVISGKAMAPVFSGQIGKKRVALFLRNGSKGTFFGVVGDKIEGTENIEDLGTANICTLGNGVPVLVIDYKNADGTKTPIFASINKKLTIKDLVTYGLNLPKRAKKAAAKTKD